MVCPQNGTVVLRRPYSYCRGTALLCLSLGREIHRERHKERQTGWQPSRIRSGCASWPGIRAQIPKTQPQASKHAPRIQQLGERSEGQISPPPAQSKKKNVKTPIQQFLLLYHASTARKPNQPDGVVATPGERRTFFSAGKISW